jgi:hypothetical protein
MPGQAVLSGIQARLLNSKKGAWDIMRRVALLGVLVVFLSGCAATGMNVIYQSVPEVQRAENEVFKVALRPVQTNKMGSIFYTSFDLTIQNKTNGDLELIWDKTLYIEDGVTKGGFMFEGVVFKDRNRPKPPDIVFAGSQFSKTIYPNVYVTYERNLGWYNKTINKPGEVGAYVTIRAKDKELHEKLIVRISQLE